MARKIIDIGTVGNDGTGDSIRDSFRKVNDNFRELYSSLGLGERLTFIDLADTPDVYVGQNDPVSGATPILTVDNTETGIAFKQLRPGSGISIDFVTNSNEITINSEFSAISADPAPQLGGDLSARSGGVQHRIKDLGTDAQPIQPIFKHEAVNKAYADTKIARAGVNAIDPETGQTNTAFGRMTGPLILARDPQPEDDEVYDGLIAATKRYVDNAAFGSVSNLFVALSGEDERAGVSKVLQGRELAFAFRTIEAALKRAEELVNEAKVVLGPYKKILTYASGTETCTLDSIVASPDSGTGFSAKALMSVDTIEIANSGANYFVGDILTLTGGNIASGGQAAAIQVLSTATTPGEILTFKIISTGVYVDELPGSQGVATTISIPAAPGDIGAIGSNAIFNVTYKVNNVEIVDQGTGYGLVSVRIQGGGGSGAFGTAILDGGNVIGITITDPGTGFNDIPVVIADLPRFLIKTEGFRTDFTGDITTDTAEAIRTRDIREGLFLRGETSGALAQILAHTGELDSLGNEIFDVDITFGIFQPGEVIAYGDITKDIQITLLIESGVYEENLPLKVSQNVSVVGDEFRRVIVRPKPGTSSSPWAFQQFRRDLFNDGLPTATQLFGHHYLLDSSQPIYPKINNKGFYRSSARLAELNRFFLQEETIAWTDFQIANDTEPFSTNFVYNRNLYRRDVGLIVDAVVFDLKYGEYNRTISAALKYFGNASGLVAITDQLSQTVATINRLRFLLKKVVVNENIEETFQDIFLQTIDNAFVAEPGTLSVIDELFDTLIDVIEGSAAVNFPKDNRDMDVFLMNDATILRAMTGQGHGGFMMVLDPTGQILAKSPYAQECASFSKSINAQVFRGGMFVDGFTGNQEFKILEKISNDRLIIGGLDRIPNLPCSFIVDDAVYRVNYIRNFIYNPEGSTAQFILDESTPWPFNLFQYDENAFSENVGSIIEGLGFDIVFGSNYNSRREGITYRESISSVNLAEQKSITLRAIDFAYDISKSLLTNFVPQQEALDSSRNIILNIIDGGVLFAPALILPNPPSAPTALINAKTLLLGNVDFIKDEAIGWVNAQIAANASGFENLEYNIASFARSVQLTVEAIAYDIIYGGNQQTRNQGIFLSLQLPLVTNTTTAAAIDRIKYLAQEVVVNGVLDQYFTGTPQVSGSATDSATQTQIGVLVDGIITTLNDGIGSAPAEILPDLEAYSYVADSVTSKGILDTNKSDIQSQTIDFVNENADKYELLMPGNRSMLSNDYTQINDLGYGIFATNGGLVEAVSMFTYYCHISYYSLNGAQIRSIGGSSAHGNFALVAEGSDPLEVPTPNNLYYNLSQRVVAYAPTSEFATNPGDLFIFVTGYNQTPLNNSELEIKFGAVMFRFPIGSVGTAGLPPGVVRLNLASGEGAGDTDGLPGSVQDGTKMSIRQLSQIILTGDLADVATRPSTGLILRESLDRVYRVLQFDVYNDTNAPYNIKIVPGNVAVISILVTITDILNNVCTTNTNHQLSVGDKFIPESTSNSIVAGTTYYVVDVPDYNKLVLSTAPGSSAVVLDNGTELNISGVRTHRLLENNEIALSSSDTLPTGLTLGIRYFVVSNNLTDTTFSVSIQRNGEPASASGSGIGDHFYSPVGLTRTTLRENYDYVGLTLVQPGEFAETPREVSIAVGATTTFTTPVAHELVVDDVIRFESTGSLPIGINPLRNYHVIADNLSSTVFEVSDTPGGDSIATSGGSGTYTFGLIKGQIGDDEFIVVPLSPLDGARVIGAQFVFLGEEYSVIGYESESVTLETFGRIKINRPLVDNIQSFNSPYTISAGVRVGSPGSLGTLTIRISLTRVTGHDLLDIGTGSYADTNYPNEIFGPPVNAVNEAQETDERDVGRVFYVTTDQFGNFSVGPFFKVDQGTGKVTFSAAIALSNLDGIGFKRGVPVSEFGIDSSMSNNAIDTVPTENAVRGYIERRLGLTHGGSPVPEGQLIPPFSGGFLPLAGTLPMKGSINMNDAEDPSIFYKVINLANPTNPRDAVNLQSLTFTNLQEFNITNLQTNNILVFTGSGNTAVNAALTGDIAITVNPSNNTVNAQINPGVIINADVNASAAIAQSKLAMNAAGTRADATGITQADRGLASFNSAEFDADNGWISVKGNGIAVGKLQTIASRTVLGNSAISPGNVSAVAFTTVVNDGGAIKKSQYSATGFLRRTSGGNTLDTDYDMIEASAIYSGSTDNDKLIQRDVNGDFGARFASLDRLIIDSKTTLDTDTTATGGFIRLFGYNGVGGIFLQDGSLAADKTTFYDNDAHRFRTQNGGQDAPIRAASVQTLSLTSGSNTTAGTITGRWTLTGTSPNESRLQATYSADLAEYYEGDKDYEVGTVLIFGGDKEVTIANKYMDTRVAGVVSNTAAFVMYDACPGYKNLVALQGRVPCKVVGKIRKGDILVTSNIAGVAIASSDARVGTVIGKALVNYDSDHIGTIEIAVGRT